jgi:hypothetical protein
MRYNRMTLRPAIVTILPFWHAKSACHYDMPNRQATGGTAILAALATKTAGVPRKIFVQI